MKQILKFAVLLCVGASLVFTSCENNDEVIPDVGSKMEFVTAPVASQNTISYLWYKVRGASKYQLQISTDPNFETIEIDEILETDHYTASVSKFGTLYYSRIRAIFSESSTSEWVETTPVGCVFDPVNVLAHPAIEIATGNTITFTWVKVPGIARIHVWDSVPPTEPGVEPVDEYIDLLPEDIDAGKYVWATSLHRPANFKAALVIAEDYEDPAWAGEELNVRGFATFKPDPYYIHILNGGVTPVIIWKDAFPVTELRLQEVGSAESPLTLVLSSAQKEAFQAEYRLRLKENTEYDISFYNGDNPIEANRLYPTTTRFATAEVATLETEISSGLYAAIGNAAYGATIKIAAGASMVLGDYTFQKAITISGIPDARGNLPEWRVEDGKVLKLNGEFKEAIAFENLKIMPADETKAMSAGFIKLENGATNSSDLKASKVMFKNCEIFDAGGGIVFLQDNGDLKFVIDSLIFDRCIVDWGGHTTMNNNASFMAKSSDTNRSNSKVNHLVITNSTVANFKGNFIRRGWACTKKITFINNTFFNFNNVNDYIFRVDNTKYAFVANNLFAAAYPKDDSNFDPVLPLGRESGNYRPNISGPPAISPEDNETLNNYATGDYLLGGTKTRYESNNYQTNSSYQWFQADALKKFGDVNNDFTSWKVFKDPENLDFRFQVKAHGRLGIGAPRYFWDETVEPLRLPIDPNPDPSDLEHPTFD